MKKLVKYLQYNIAQLLFLIAVQRIRILEWGRGTGKSTVLAKAIIDCVEQMPRSTGVMPAATYAQILTRTLPSTIAGLEKLGYIKDQHYFVGSRPPKSWKWPEAYEPPLDYKRAVTFWNGATMLLVSQDSSAGSGRGLNVDWIVGDEAALLDEKKFQTDVLLTNRGNLYRVAHYPDGSQKYFKDCPLHHSVTLATSTPVTAKGKWILKYEEQAVLHPDRVSFLRASAECNRHNLGDDYFEEAKATMPDFLYNAEVLNIRMKRIEDGFYPMLDEDVHTYNDFNYDQLEQLVAGTGMSCLGDADLDRDEPLIIGIDWGKNINCMVVTQANDIEHKILKNHYVLYPKILDDLIDDEFVPYYKPHRKKEVYMWYDPSGNVGVANSRKTYAQQAKDKLISHGWTVYLMTLDSINIKHELKYYLMIDILKGDDKYPNMRFNRSNCKELWISMNNAPAKAGANDSIKKDKSSERSKTVDQEHATHFSDALDSILVGMYINRMKSTPGFIPDRIM